MSVTTTQSQAIDRDKSKQIELFIRHMLQVDESRNIKEYAKFYAPTVVSNGETMSKSEYMATIKNTYKKWPLCGWMLIDKPSIKGSVEANRFEVKFRASYRAKNTSLSLLTEGKVLTKIVIIKGENDMPVISLIDLKQYDTFTYNEGKESRQSRITKSEPVVSSDNIYGQIDRIQSIRDPNQRANANADFLRGMLGNFDQLVESNPQAFGGMSSDEFTLETYYNAAREKGLPPSEAQIEAQRQFMNKKRFMNQ